MKYIKKLSIGLVIAVLSSGIFIGLVPSKAYAAPGDPITIKEQYVIYKSADLLKKCIFIANEYKTTNEKDVINSIFKTDGGENQLGKLYGKFLGTNDTEFECNTPKYINAALSKLGYDDIYNFAAEMGFPNDKLTKKDLDTKIDKRVQDKGVPNDLYGTRRFRYWYYNAVFRAELADGGCKGTLADEPSATAKTNIGPRSFWNVGRDEAVKEYKYARYEVETGSNLPDLDDEVLKNTGLGTSEITCIKIAREITKERAEAYAAFLDTPEGGAEKPANAAGTSGTGSDSIGSGGDGEDEINVQCSVSLSNPLSYFMCPLITGFIKAMNALDQAITDQLTVDTENYIQGTQAESFKQVWTNMRNLAISFIVIVGLLMVIGTAVEVGPFDPYTVKKVMPRLLVAVIVISLSWPLVIFLINASNSLGLTIKGLIQQPFTELLEAPIQFGGGQQWAAAAGFAGAGVALGIVGLLSFVATAFLGVALAFLVLVLRQILVILLAVIAPIAIAMYILPNTQKAGKAWWDLFARALLVFPIIAAFIATGRVFAAITVANSGGSPGTIEGFIAFFAYYGPYFALPFAFRLAGGAVAQIGGFVNDKSRGGFDRLKKFRQGQTQKNAQKVVEGRRFKETGFANRLNTPLQGAALVASGKAGIDPRLMRSKLASAQEQQALNQAGELLEKNEAFRQIAGDDDLLKAVSSDGDRAAITAALKATNRYNPDQLPGLVNMVEQARNSGSRSATRKASTLGLAATTTGFATNADMYEAINNSTNDVSVRNAMIAKAKSLSANGGRYDMSEAGHVDQYAAAADLANGTKTAKQVNNEMRQKSFAQGGVHKMVAMKSSAFGAVTTQLADDYQAAIGRGDQSAATEIASQIASLRNASGSASPENRKHINAMLEAAGVELGSDRTVDQQLGTKLGTTFGLNTGEVTQEIRTRAGLYDQGTQQTPQGVIAGMGPIPGTGPSNPGGVSGP